MKDLPIRTTPQVSGNTVVVEIEYTQESRGRIRETRQHDMMTRDGTTLINSDQLLTSQITKGSGNNDKRQQRMRKRTTRTKTGGTTATVCQYPAGKCSIWSMDLAVGQNVVELFCCYRTGMRQSGVVTDVRCLGPHDHVCWGFDDDTEFRAAAVSFLDAGLALGQRVRYVGPLEDGVHTALTGAPPGAVEVVTVDAQYATSTVLDPRTQVETYATATADALTAGFTGLRVATDVTALVARPAHLDAAVRYEHRVDHLMARQPLSAMCAYNRTVLGADALAQLASVHPLATESATPFWLCASSTPGCAAALGGELDLTCADLLELTLQRADLRPVDGALVFDAAELTFVDRSRLAVLVEHARRLGAILVLKTDQPAPQRLIRLLAWDNLRLEAAT